MADKMNPDIAAEDGETHKWRHRLRSAVTALLVISGCLSFSALVAVHWAERQIFTTDNWVAMVTPWPKQPAVYNALGSFISDQVFTNAPIQAEIADALPPKAAFLAGPLTGQLKSLT